MADLKQLGIKVSQEGFGQVNGALKTLAERAFNLVEPLKNMQAQLLISNDMDLSKLVQSVKTVAENAQLMRDSLKGIGDIGNGFKGISTSFSTVATSAEKISTSVAGVSAFNEQLIALRENLLGIKDVTGTLGIKIGPVTVKGTSGSGGTSRSTTTPQDTQTNEAYTASQKRLIAQLEREALQVGKTRAEYLAARAAKLGLSEVAAPYITQLQKATTTSDKYVMSQRELSAAMRNVPAQFTDIATQLAGGQSPWLIMLQQGGQLRDMFHGFGPMFRNVGSMVLKFLTNPFVIAAGVIGGLTAVFTLGAKEAEDYGKAIALTGNYSKISVNQFLELQKSLDGIGVSKSAAADALTAIAAAGLRTNLNMVDLTKTMLDFSKQSGTAIGDVVAEYKSLEKDPVQAILALNDKYHFLTASVYQHITSLVKQGEQTKAVELAQKELERAHQEMSTKIESNLGWLEKGWAGLVKVIKGAKDAVLEFGREKPQSTIVSGLKTQLADINKSLSYQVKGSAFEAQLLKEKKAVEDQLKAYESVNQKRAVSKQLTQEDINAQTRINSLIGDGEKKSHSQVAMKRELALLDKQIAEQQAKGAVYSSAQIEAARKAIRDQYVDKGAANKTSSINTELQQILEATRAYKAETAQLNQLGLTFDKTSEARKKLNAYQAEVSSGKASEDRLKLLRTLIPALKEEAAAEDANKKAKTSWDEAKQVHEKALSITALLEAQKEEIATLESTGATQSKVSENERQSILLKKKAAEATDSRIAAIMNEASALYGEAAANEKVIKSLTEVNNLKSRGSARQTAGSGELSTLKEKLDQGDVTDSRKLLRNEEYESTKKINALIKEQTDARNNNNQAAVEELQNQINYEQQLRDEKKKTIEQYDAEKGTIEGLIKSSGRAWDDFIGSAKSSEQDLHSLFSSSFSTMTDTFNTFFTTGKLGFKSMTVSILKNIEEIIVKTLIMRAVMGIASSFAGAASGGSATTAPTTVPTSTQVWAAHGEAFNESGLHKFAKGSAFTNNLYTSTTPIAFAKGNKFAAGVIGEAGPEAVMPLGRTSSGDLGVKTIGSGTSYSNITPTVNVTVNVDNSGSSSTEKSSSTSDTMAALGGMIAKVATDVIIQQKRPGGLLAA